MKKHISFLSIDQFRTVVSNINRRYNFVGLDDNGDAIYDPSKPKPKLKFKGTVKLHGTNFGVCYNDIAGLWAQSRENIITPQSDNAGSAFFVEANKEAFLELFNQIKENHGLDLTKNTISIYGEWVGKGIQKAVAISNLEKSMFIFGVKITPHPKDENDKTPAYWVDSTYLKNPEHKIYNINDYASYEIEIDFNYPQLVQNKIIEMTIEVENECPVGKAFGYIGIGEGLVFSYHTENGEVYRFKSKGEKHSKASKVTTLKPVDDAKINKIIETVNNVCVSWRLDQALTAACDLMNGGSIDRKHLGNYIRLVIADVIKEESDTIAEAGLEPKDLNSKISEVARQYFFQRELDEVGLK
jgi:hypothetical protein